MGKSTYRQFKGTPSQYRMLHLWVQKQKGKAVMCERCGVLGKTRYHWANISGEYKQDLSDWEQSCARCNQLGDTVNFCKRGHERTDDNTYTYPSGRKSGLKECRECRKLLRTTPNTIKAKLIKE